MRTSKKGGTWEAERVTGGGAVQWMGPQVAERKLDKEQSNFISE